MELDLEPDLEPDLETDEFGMARLKATPAGHHGRDYGEIP